jgi:hypothetical protein
MLPVMLACAMLHCVSACRTATRGPTGAWQRMPLICKAEGSTVAPTVAQHDAAPKWKRISLPPE